jgi:P-type E1-E2 ATPase
VRGRVDGRPTTVGSHDLAAEALGASPLGRGGAGTAVAVIGEGRLLGTLRFAETRRPSADRAVSALRDAGIGVGLVSGDRQAGMLVPVPFAPDEVACGLLPEDKVAYVRAARARGAVAVVGDGLNDAPALAVADLGIAVADATDLARLTADVVVLGTDLGKIPWLLAHARRVRRVVRENLAWAFAYNVVAVGLATAGALSPILAAFAMIASSVAVVANAHRLGGARGAQSIS